MRVLSLLNVPRMGKAMNVSIKSFCVGIVLCFLGKGVYCDVCGRAMSATEYLHSNIVRQIIPDPVTSIPTTNKVFWMKSLLRDTSLSLIVNGLLKDI